MDRRLHKGLLQGAQETLVRHRGEKFDMLSIQDEAHELFVNAVLNPSTPNDAARAAAQRYKKDIWR